MKILSTAIIATLLAGNAYAGSISTTPVEAEPDVLMAAPLAGWTGFYAGLQYGQGDADVSFDGFSLGGDFDALGVHAGYMQDMGQYVLGAELAYNKVEVDAAPDEDDDGDLFQLRGRAGVDLGNFMPYVTLGFARLSEDDVSETGFTYGVGAEYLLSDRFSVGLEYSQSKFSDVLDAPGVDLDADLLQIRTSFRF